MSYGEVGDLLTMCGDLRHGVLICCVICRDLMQTEDFAKLGFKEKDSSKESPSL